MKSLFFGILETNNLEIMIVKVEWKTFIIIGSRVEMKKAIFDNRTKIWSKYLKKLCFFV